jgi:FkbM family methyltransferase
MKPLETIDITYAVRTVALPNVSRYAKFYAKLAPGMWEPRKFSILGRNLDEETVCVDRGARISVTPFSAARTAKHVVAVKPDSTCIKILSNQSASHPNLIVVHGALASTESAALNSVDGFGSSASSVLGIGSGECIAVNGRKMDDVMRSIGQSPIFVKIDIEGFEYILIEEIKELLKYNLNWCSRQWRSFGSARKVANIFHGCSPYPTVTGYGSLLSHIFFGILLNFKPKGMDLNFERASLPQ